MFRAVAYRQFGERDLAGWGRSEKRDQGLAPLFTAAAPPPPPPPYGLGIHTFIHTPARQALTHTESQRASCGEAAKSLSTRRVNGIHTSKYARRSRILTASSHTQQLCFLVCLPNELSRSTFSTCSLFKRPLFAVFCSKTNKIPHL